MVCTPVVWCPFLVCNTSKLVVCAFCADLQAVPQSYCAVIHSFVRNDQPENALAVFASMQRSSISAYLGWLTITNQLYAAGHPDMAEQCVMDRQSGWQPDADLYEHIIKSICSADAGKSAVYNANTSDPDPPADSADNDDDQLRAANNVVTEMKVLFQQSVLLSST